LLYKASTACCIRLVQLVVQGWYSLLYKADGGVEVTDILNSPIKPFRAETTAFCAMEFWKNFNYPIK